LAGNSIHSASVQLVITAVACCIPAQSWIRVIRSEISRQVWEEIIIYIDWENDIVVVVRRINPGPSLNDVVGKMLAYIKTPTQKDALAKQRARTL
jgi:hypothetical protein